MPGFRQAIKSNFSMDDKVKITFEIDRDFIRGVAALSGISATNKEETKKLIKDDSIKFI